jgi:hypothetical protein
VLINISKNFGTVLPDLARGWERMVAQRPKKGRLQEVRRHLLTAIECWWVGGVVPLSGDYLADFKYQGFLQVRLINFVTCSRG